MIELTLGAQQRLESYFAELRRVLVDDGKADPGDVERDIRDHIQTALADAGGPVDESRLDQVLRSLGAPAEWIDSPDRPWFAKPPKAWFNSAKQSVTEKVHRFAAGPESYRLPYLSLLTLVLGVILAILSGDAEGGVAIFVMATIGAFVLARAALAIQPDQGPTNAQLWLMSPALLMVYVPLWIALVAWPLIPGGILVEEAYHLPRAQLQAAHAMRETFVYAHDSGNHLPRRIDGQLVNPDYDEQLAIMNANILELQAQQGSWHTVLFVTVFALSVWWLVIGFLEWKFPQFFRTVFAPYSLRSIHRVLFYMAVILILASGVFLG